MGLATLSRMTAAAEAAQLGLAYRLQACRNKNGTSQRETSPWPTAALTRPPARECKGAGAAVSYDE
jgi:hypothetical protein